MEKQDINIMELPTKEEIIQVLKDENPPINNKEKYSQLMLVLEFKRIKQNLGILKGEYYNGDKLEHRGSLLTPIIQINKESIWNNIGIGESHFYGFSLDTREEKTLEKIGGFFRRSFDGATLQDFIPFASGGKNRE